MGAWNSTESFDGSDHINDSSRLPSRQASRLQPRLQVVADTGESEGARAPGTPGDAVSSNNDQHLHRQRSKVMFSHSNSDLQIKARLLSTIEDEGMHDEDMAQYEQPGGVHRTLQSRQSVKIDTDRDSHEIETLLGVEESQCETLGHQKVVLKGKGVSYSCSMDVVDMPSATSPTFHNGHALLRYALMLG